MFINYLYKLQRLNQDEHGFIALITKLYISNVYFTLSNYLTQYTSNLEKEHRVVIVYLRNGVIHIIDGIAYSLDGGIQVSHIDMRIGFLETTSEEGGCKRILCQVLMEGLAYLGLTFLAETTYIVKHWHGTGIR